MKMTLKVATILTWFNLIFWGLIIGLLLLGALSAMFLPGLLIAVLMSAIPLNCYAALRLQKSIRDPNVPLSQQTPMGIRFVGFIALFFGVNSIGEGFALIKDAREILDFLKDYYMKQAPEIAQMPAFKAMGIADVKVAGVIVLILGLCMTVNVILNLRLLKWYLLLRKHDEPAS
jgi:hypothetical protein